MQKKILKKCKNNLQKNQNQTENTTLTAPGRILSLTSYTTSH